MVTVFTNGCFDLLHVGHVRLLETARALGDRLVVGLNSDEGVERLKGPGRPIIPFVYRREMLQALRCVDMVYHFNYDPLHLIEVVAPDVLVKGADWEANNIIGKAVVEEQGGKVVRIPLVEGISTTEVIKRVLALCEPPPMPDVPPGCSVCS